MGGEYGEYLYFSCRLIDSIFGTPIVGIQVIFQDDNTGFFDSSCTDGDGYAYCIAPPYQEGCNVNIDAEGSGYDNESHVLTPTYDWYDGVTVFYLTPHGQDEEELEIYTPPTNLNPTYGSSGYLCSEAVSNGTVYYKIGNESYSTTRPRAVGRNAGTYTLWYYAFDGSYTSTEDYSITVTIGKANQSAPTATGSEVNCGSTATATATGGGGQGTLTWTNGSTRTAVGSQTTKAYWSGNSNYNASGYSNEVTLKVNTLSNTLSILPTSKTIYNTSGYNTFTITPSNAQGGVTYQSSNTSVATVNSSGVVTYAGAGTCKIIVTAAGSGCYSSGYKDCTVTCVTDSVKSLSASTSTSSISYGGTSTITVTATYESGFSTDVTTSASYSTNPTGIVTIFF